MTSYSERQIGDDGAFREAQEREAATREILKVLSRSRDDEKPVFDAILENAARLCSVPTALLFLVNEEKTHFLLADVWGEWANPKDAGEAWPLDGSLPVAQSIREARTIHLEDVAETAAYRDGDPTYVYLVEEEGLHTRLCVPLVHDGTALGAIALSRHEVRPFSGDEIALVETFAEQAVIAIENVRQFR
ncbi:MAG: GAF domain-containing protein, partial [Paracoccaceae bacterium]